MAKKKSESLKNKGPATIQNRRARHDYELVETYEAGLVLAGSEVKSLYLGRASLADAFCYVTNGELWLINMDIEPYTHASHFQHDRRRERKLLMKRSEINTLQRKTEAKGFSLIPTKVYFNERRKAKVQIALARGKKQHDKRESIKEKDQTRAFARGMDY